MSCSTEPGAAHYAGCPCHESAWAARLAAAEAQLPEGMKHCTIVFRECAKGHGWLTATNWTEFPCPTCAIAAAEADRAAVRNAYNELSAAYAAAEARCAALEGSLRELDSLSALDYEGHREMLIAMRAIVRRALAAKGEERG